MKPVEPKDKIYHGLKTKTPALLILPLLLGWLQYPKALGHQAEKDGNKFKNRKDRSSM